MPTVNFILADGTQRSVEARIGDTLMMTAVNNDISGVIAECGGSMMCGTCHCYVPEDWVQVVPTPMEGEIEMLDSVEGERTEFSRLSCQISITEAMDGITVKIPN